MEIIGTNKSCYACGCDTRQMSGHHLSYDPEIVVFLCRHCHFLLHTLQRMPGIRLDLFLNWIKTYGHNWENGTEKYFKSEFKKQALKRNGEIWASNNPDKIRERGKRFRERHPDRVKEQKRRTYLKYYPKNKDKINAKKRLDRKMKKLNPATS